MKCQWCQGPVKVPARGRTPRFCASRCRVAAHRHAKTLPEELTLRARWIRWAARDGRKVPVNASGRAVNAHDPKQWVTVDDLDRQEPRGFVLNGDGIVCIDLDNCLDRHGDPLPWCRQFLAGVPPTWIERSPSGKGLHIWGLADFPTGKVVRYYNQSIEIYGDRRFITVAGTPVAQCPTTLADLQEVIDNFI